jgi:hypothetical protein
MNGFSRALRRLAPSLLACIALLAASRAPAWPALGGTGVVVCDAPGLPNLAGSAPDGHGGVFIGWTDARTGQPRVFAQHVDGAGTPLWTADGIQLNSSTVFEPPRLVSDGADGVIIVWRDFRADTAGNVYAQHLSSNGIKLWGSSDVAVAAGPLHETYPSVSSDGVGGAFVAWSDDRTGTSDVRVQRLTAQGGLDWGPDGVPLSAPWTGNFPIFSQVCSDAAGGALVGFSALVSGHNNAYVQRVSPAGVPQWTPGGVQASTSTLGTSCADLAADGTGGALVALRDNRSQNSWQQAFAQRIAANGSLLWAQDGVPLSGSTDPVEEQNVVADGAGGGFFEWRSYLNDGSGTSLLLVQRVSAAGAPQWNASTQWVASANDGGNGWLHSRLLADGTGGAVLGWNALGTQGGFDISAQRLAADGTRLWSAGPCVLASPANTAWQLGLVPDGTGGAVASWVNYLGSGIPYTVAAERVMGTGTLDVSPTVPTPRGVRCDPSPARAGEAITLRFRMWEPGEASVGVFDVSGRLVRSLSLAIWIGPGGAAGLHPHAFEQALVWDGRDSQGRRVPPALYLVRVRTSGSGEASGRVVVVQ